MLVGQYERRIYFAEKDGIVRRKLLAALKHGLQPILCVGENADQLDEGLGPYVVAQQLEAALEGVHLDARLVIAYEPVWTTMGLVAPPPLNYVADMFGHIRETLSVSFPAALPSDVRVIYWWLRQPPQHRRDRRPPAIDGVLSGATSINADQLRRHCPRLQRALGGSSARNTLAGSSQSSRAAPGRKPSPTSRHATAPLRISTWTWLVSAVSR